MIKNSNSSKECDRDSYDINKAAQDLLKKQQEQEKKK